MKTIVLQDYGGYRFIYQLAYELFKSLKVIYIYSSSSGGANSDYTSEQSPEVIELGKINHDKDNLFTRKKMRHNTEEKQLIVQKV